MNLPTSITTNPEFVAANSHIWFAYAVVLTFHASPWAVGGMLVAAAVKEFVVDHLWETPPQPFSENLKDWLGYAGGTGLAIAASFAAR
jgi:ABC-type glycerol-3-phosphate transport system substrate-binding protein